MVGIVLLLLLKVSYAESIKIGTVTTDLGCNTTLTCSNNTKLGSDYNYRWFRYVPKYTRLKDGHKYSGTDTETLTIINTDNNDTGRYRCDYENVALSSCTLGTTYDLLHVRGTATPDLGCNTTLTCLNNTQLGSDYYYKWLRYGPKTTRLKDGHKYSGTDTETLTIINTNNNNTGRYVCGYINDTVSSLTWGTRYDLHVREPESTFSFNYIYVAVGIGAVLVVLFVVIVVIRRRKQNKRNRTDGYEMRDINQGEEHSYMQTRTNDAPSQPTIQVHEQSIHNEDILTPYNVGELSTMLLDAQLCATKMQEEFQWLKEHSTEESGTGYESASFSDYDDVETRYDTYVNTAVIKVTDICPTTDKPLEMPSLEIKMTSFESKENDVLFYSLKLTDQEEYEMCYKVLRHYMEKEHQYSYIE